MTVRRQVGRWSCAAALLGLAGLGAAPALAADCPNPMPPTIRDLPDPPELQSVGGVLRGTLRIAPAEITVRGCKVVSNVINGDYMAPTLRIRQGDTIRVRAVNRIDAAEVNIDGPQPTNIHYHGMDVAPSRRPPGDNVFIRIRPDRRLRYDVFVPEDHPQGLHWYHAHVHHFVDDQIGSGVSGMLIVDGFIEEQYPELADLRRRVNIPRSQVPAVTHVDYSARIQTVDSVRNPSLHGLLDAFYSRTGCPVLVNTSFNVRGEPIVCTPADAFQCFLATDMDVLVLENCVLLKEHQPPGSVQDAESYKAQYALD